MLILTRKPGNKVLIGNDVTVTVIDAKVHPNGEIVVALGFDAPRHICIDREEIRIKRVNSIDRLLNGTD